MVQIVQIFLVELVARVDVKINLMTGLEAQVVEIFVLFSWRGGYGNGGYEEPKEADMKLEAVL